jgi:phage terminase large subunit-like protein
VNNGGDLIEHTLRTVDKRIPYKKVTASRGKRIRAEPVAALYEQGRVFHAQPFPDLEDQLSVGRPTAATAPTASTRWSGR